ncbi:YIP1 family protein [Alkalihalophilus sp. As8PL]|uniref:YIP1 family protein n=1 Tax=Alkalihalophilus sp. As8PL TaxID=3237103 RepID=A0AB39BVH3_9BACI
MNRFTLLAKALMLDGHSFRELADSPKTNRIGLLLVVLLGAAYGLFSVQANLEYVSSFESPLLRNIIVPLIFIVFGIITIILTRFAFTLLLWAGAKGFGGPGLMRSLYRISIIILVPSFLAMPTLIGMQAGFSITVIHVVLLLAGLAWMYVLGVRAMEATQSFKGLRSYGSVLAIFIFFACVYYLVIPPAS